MKEQISRELIESLCESGNQEFFENVSNQVFNLVSSAVDDIASKSPFIRADKCVFMPVNESILGTFSQLSQFDYFLGVDNPQIAMNSKKMRNFWKFAWQEFKANWRIGRRKERKRDRLKREREAKMTPAVVDKYKLSDFRHDMVRNMANYLSETTIIYEFLRHVSLMGGEDFGTNVKINIYVCIYSEKDNVFKLYSERKNKYTTVDFGDRLANLEAKQTECGDMFRKMITLFNALYAKAYNKVPNQILIESLIWGCPVNLFDENDVYKTFVNVSNYVRLVSPSEIMSICDRNKSVFKEPLIVEAGAQTQFGKVVNMLDGFKF